ncbi:host attachment family protein [Jannaschia sp. M317]|uniref:host attachment family protein n=1 Tax=Jannaschia sp. M317 TaxID=2867011 RepID=UPI0021A50E46|nr:host attachment family protein [Jannaschia sp. M317]UWQ16757.1 host attachment family protein [Jannaschia sp. M317]
MTGIPHNTLVVVSDSEKALFLINRTDAENPNFDLIRKDEEENPPAREQAANRRGRVQESAGSGVSAYEDTDFHELQKERFAADLADKLYKMAHAGKFEKLVIVASPQVLGVVRDEMHKEVRDKLIGTVDKTLTNHPVHEIEEIVTGALRDAA